MAIDASAVARVVGIDTAFKNLRSGGIVFLPMRIAVFAQGATASVYSSTKFQATSAADVGSRMGYGSPAHLVARQLFPMDGDGVGTIPVTFYPLSDAVSGVASTGSVAPSGSQTKAAEYRLRINNILSAAFVLSPGMTTAQIAAAMTAAVNAVLEMPVVASTLTSPDRTSLVSKWKGVSANDIYIEVLGEALGVTFTITQPTGGLVDPTLDTPLTQIGNVWETLLLNALPIANTTALDAIKTVGDARWGQLVKKPFVCFTGNTIGTSVANATAVSSVRTTDRINGQLVSPDSHDLPFVVAARELAKIAVVANNNPPTDYGSQRATGLTPGADQNQWDYAKRDQAVKAGSSTVEIKDGVVCLSDIVTFWRPTGEEPPAYRYVVDIIKLMNVIFNIDLIFADPRWDGAPLIPDDQPTVNPNARKPKSAKADVNAMIDSLALNAIISDPKTAKKKTVAVINSQNPKRLDVTAEVQVSGNSNIKSVTLNWGFFFGSAA